MAGRVDSVQHSQTYASRDAEDAWEGTGRHGPRCWAIDGPVVTLGPFTLQNTSVNGPDSGMCEPL